MEQAVNEIEERRRKHLARLEKTFAEDFDERFETKQTHDQKRREALSDMISADWNAKYKAREKAEQQESDEKALPADWRDAHWKTLIVMARDFAGVEAENKEEAIEALEAYEAGLN